MCLCVCVCTYAYCFTYVVYIVVLFYFSCLWEFAISICIHANSMHGSCIHVTWSMNLLETPCPLESYNHHCNFFFIVIWNMCQPFILIAHMVGKTLLMGVPFQYYVKNWTWSNLLITLLVLKSWFFPHNIMYFHCWWYFYAHFIDLLLIINFLCNFQQRYVTVSFVSYVLALLDWIWKEIVMFMHRGFAWMRNVGDPLSRKFIFFCVRDWVIEQSSSVLAGKMPLQNAMWKMYEIGGLNFYMDSM